MSLQKSGVQSGYKKDKSVLLLRLQVAYFSAEGQNIRRDAIWDS